MNFDYNDELLLNGIYNELAENQNNNIKEKD